MAQYLRRQSPFLVVLNHRAAVAVVVEVVAVVVAVAALVAVVVLVKAMAAEAMMATGSLRAFASLMKSILFFSQPVFSGLGRGRTLLPQIQMRNFFFLENN